MMSGEVLMANDIRVAGMRSVIPQREGKAESTHRSGSFLQQPLTSKPTRVSRPTTLSVLRDTLPMTL